jgi:hypothetical protein
MVIQNVIKHISPFGFFIDHHILCSLSELVKDNVNGFVFENSKELSKQFVVRENLDECDCSISLFSLKFIIPKKILFSLVFVGWISEKQNVATNA